MRLRNAKRFYTLLVTLSLCITIYETATGRLRVMCCVGNPPMCTVTEG